MSLMPQFEFHLCLSEEGIQLQQLIDKEASGADDTLDLSTAFLIIKDIKTNTGLQEIPEPLVLARLFLASLSEPYSSYLSGNYLTHTWDKLSFQEAEKRIVKLLTQGAMVEPSIFNNIEQALKFTHRLLQCMGEPCNFLTNVRRDTNSANSGASSFSVFKVGNCWDEGVILSSSTKVGALWFLGYD